MTVSVVRIVRGMYHPVHVKTCRDAQHAAEWLERFRTTYPEATFAIARDPVLTLGEQHGGAPASMIGGRCP